MMGETWEQKRKLLLSLGTQTYRKPTELPLQFFDTFMGPEEDFLWGSVKESILFFRQGCGTTLGVQPRAILRKL